MKTSLVVRIILAALVLLPQSLAPAVIVVDGPCTLVDAITAANSDAPTGGCPAGSGADEIQLTADVTLTQVAGTGDDGDNGLPSVTSEIAVDGGGFAVSRDDAAPLFRIFHVATGGTLELDDTTVSNGHAGGSSSDGGAILNRGSLTLSHSTVADSTAGDFDDGTGGGIFNTGSLSLYYSTVDNNGALAYIGHGGGGIFNGDGGTALLVGSTISDNFATVEYAFGGGLGGDGFTLINSTLSGNRGNYGAAIFGSATLINSTVTQNTASPADGPTAAALWGTFTLYNTVLDKYDYPYSYQINCAGTITDGGNNLADDDTCGTIPSSLTGLDPVLTDNGGPTLTHALLDGSSAIDAAGDCGLETDQRGSPRVGPCDSGSFELGGLSFLLSTTICPGPSTITATRATPMTLVHLFEGPAEGPSEVLGGPCAGTHLLITEPTEIAVFPVDEGGTGSVVIDFQASDCGQFLQGLDASNCGTSTVEGIDSCNPLGLTHSGSGGDPTASPPGSPGCESGEYLPDERIQLIAHPDPDWEVGAWSGTDDDSSTEIENTVTMPPQAHEVAVHYVRTCFLLTVDHVGSGADPFASPPGSSGCVDGRYREGEIVGLTASPDSGWEVGSWTGTDDDSSTQTTNSLTMPAADHAVGVEYVEICYSLTVDHTGSGADPTVVPLGDGTAWSEHLVDGDFDGAESVFAADVDGDGDLDVLGSAVTGDDIAWWENTLGDGTAWSEHLVDGDFDGAESVYAGDVDGDGDVDVLGAADIAHDIAWWENTLGDGTAWSKHTVDPDFNNVQSVYAGDVDGDGDLDVLGAAFLADEITWWENALGDGSAWSERLIDGEFGSATAIHSADVDGDGDLDVLGAAAGDDDIAWWENTLGDGTVWTEHLIDGEVDLAVSVHAADVDSDGDMDVLGTSALDDEITWWENILGDGTAWTEHLVDGQFDNARSVYAADVDGDGDPDVLGAAHETFIDEVRLWENTYTGVCGPGDFRGGDRLRLTATPDPGWEVGGWSGTDDDSSTETANTTTMPDSDHTVTVHYVDNPCVLKLQVRSTVVQSGGTIAFTLFLQHNRPRTVTVPFRVWVEDQDGSFIVGTKTPPITFEPGDTFRRRMTLELPESLTPGRYFVRASIDQMQQGVASAKRQTLVTD